MNKPLTREVSLEEAALVQQQQDSNIKSFIGSLLYGDGEIKVGHHRDGKFSGNVSAESVHDLLIKASDWDANGRDAYFAPAKFKTSENRKKSNVLGARALWLDIDVGLDKASKGVGYASKVEASKALGNFLTQAQLPAPTHIVSSGNGLHVYFVVDRLLPTDEWEKAANQLKELTTHYGFVADPSRTADIASVLRIPGTHNFKDKSSPKPVELKLCREPTDSAKFILAVSQSHSKIVSNLLSDQVSPAIAKLFKLESLSPTPRLEKYPFSPETAKEFLAAAKIAYPNIQDYDEFREFGFECASLVALERWDADEVKRIFDAVCYQAENANTSNNNAEWEQYLQQTLSKASKEEPISTYRSTLRKALDQGWNRELSQPMRVQGFALIRIGSKVGIIDLAQADSASTINPLSVYSREDGSLLIKREIKAANLTADASKAVNEWMTSPQTPVYNGVELNPDGTTQGFLNLWHGLSISPRKGRCGLIREFIREVICSGSDELFHYVWNWLAHMLQRPEEKPGISLVLMGGQGIGKGTFAAKIIGAMYADHFLHLQTDKALTGDFNDSLESSFVIFADEAFFSGDRKAANTLKSIETEDRIHINPKYQPSRQIISYHRIISASNNDHAAYVEHDDRRKVILRVSEAHKGDWGYWNSLDREIKNGGLEALAYELLASDISTFQVRNKPNTNELLNQKLASLDPISQWWVDRLVLGAQLSSGVDWTEFAGTMALYDDFIAFTKTQFARGRTASTREFAEKLKQLVPSITQSRIGGANSRKKGFKFPPLETARKDFETRLGGAIAW